MTVRPALGLLAMVLALIVVFTSTPARPTVAQEPSRPSPISPPSLPADQTTPGRWEVFAGGRDAPGEFASSFGRGVGVDSTGTIYVGDPDNKRMQKLTPDGAPAGEIPIWPGYIGYVGQIQSIVVTPGGEIVVLFSSPLVLAGPEPYYLIRYAASGRPLGQFGRAGPEPDGLSEQGGYDRPGGFDVAPDGTIWVADTPHHRLIAYARDGRLLRTIGGQGSAPGQFKRPGGVGVAPNGTLYVADTGNDRVQILAPDGAVLGIWDNAGPEPDQLKAPNGIRVGRDGSVFVARESGVPYRFQKLGPDGTLLAGAWLSGVSSFAVTQDGNVLVAGGYSELVRRFNANLEEYDPLVSIKVPPETPGRLLSPSAVAFDPQQNVYIADGKQAAVYVYAPDGTLLSRWGTRGFDFGQLRAPSAIVITTGGTIYIADYELDRIYKYASDWSLLDVWGGSGSGPGRLSGPNDLALDAAGNVYVADRGNARIQKFGSGGDLLATYQATDTSVRRTDSTMGAAVTVDALGRIYTHGESPKIVRILPDGTVEREYGAPTRGVFTGETIDGDGNLWLLDYQNNALWKLDQDGQALAVWGSASSQGGARLSGPDFSRPNTVSVDPSGRVYVTDGVLARVWRFTPERMQ